MKVQIFKHPLIYIVSYIWEHDVESGNFPSKIFRIWWWSTSKKHTYIYSFHQFYEIKKFQDKKNTCCSNAREAEYMSPRTWLTCFENVLFSLFEKMTDHRSQIKPSLFVYRVIRQKIKSKNDPITQSSYPFVHQTGIQTTYRALLQIIWRLIENIWVQPNQC
jgi:hypothetical protein